MEYQSNEYDDKLRCISHYGLYPEMMPWIGKDYPESRMKLLLLGESHYLEENSTYHHDRESWYAGIDVLMAI